MTNALTAPGTSGSVNAPEAAATTEPGIPAPQIATATAAWHDWRQARAAQLDVPFGWLSLTGLTWLDNPKITVPGLPGLWWTSDEAILVDFTGVSQSDREQLNLTFPAIIPGSLVHSVSVPEGQSITGATLANGSEVEFLARSGQRGLRIRAKNNRPLDSDGLVPAAPYDPQWIKPARATWFEQGRQVIVGSAQPGLQHHTVLTGQLTFHHEGRDHTLFLTGTGEQTVVTFADTAKQTAAWRFLKLDLEAEAEGTLTLDFNYAQNYPSAFSAYGTCPAPADGNTLPIAVFAGELAP